MPLDPRIIQQAAPAPAPPFDPLRAMGQVYQLQGMQQQAQMGQLAMADAQRQEQERRDLGAIYRRHVVTDPTTGQATLDLPGAMTEAYRVNPVTAFKMQQEYTQTRAETTKTALEAQKAQTEQALKGLEFGGQVAQGVEDRIAAGTDPQEAWQWGLETMRRAGLPTQGITPTYDATMLAGWKGQALQLKDKLEAQHKAIANQLREQELLETQKRTTLEQRRTAVQERELGVRREDIEERRAERLQQRQTQAESRTFEQENKLRDEYQAQNKSYREVRDAWGRIETTGAATTPTVANDYALIYSFMKMLDPMTGIRDAETRSAVEAGGLPAQTQRWIEWVQGNKVLPDNIRSQFVETGKRLYDQYTRENEASRTYYTDLARQYGLKPERVIQDLRATPVPREAGAGGTGGGATARSPYADIPVEKLTPQQRAEEKAWLQRQVR